MKTKSQLSVELIVLLAFILFVLLSAIAVFNSRMFGIPDKVGNDVKSAVEDIKETIFNEISLARQAEPGYAKELLLPSEIDSEKYFIQVDDNLMLVINHSKKSYVFQLPPNVVGGFCMNYSAVNYSAVKGNYKLIIIKQDEIISISASPGSLYSYYECDSAEKGSDCNAIEQSLPGFVDECCRMHCRCCS
ncbi:hypothetical protein JXB31_02880 [Candidatus Woesearchaeota archaeon]|nr:hypothetical protein [Candidatus Woesearchaeota archaeon]